MFGWPVNPHLNITIRTGSKLDAFLGASFFSLTNVLKKNDAIFYNHTIVARVRRGKTVKSL